MAIKIVDANGHTVKVAGRGHNGEPGHGVPAGGSPGQILVKRSENDYDTEWKDIDGSGIATPETVNSAIQEAILDSWEGSY